VVYCHPKIIYCAENNVSKIISLTCRGNKECTKDILKIKLKKGLKMALKLSKQVHFEN